MIKNPQKAKKVFFSFLRVEVKLALAILFEGWDFSTCVFLCCTHIPSVMFIKLCTRFETGVSV